MAEPRLAAATWTDLAADGPIPAGARLLVVPLGSTEQHGPHLPFDTDTRIAVALVEGLASARADVVVAPAVAYGSSGEHAGFPGTVSVGQEAFEAMVVELCRSVDAFAGVVLVNGHGGNAVPLARASEVLEAEARAVLTWSWSAPGADAHAGRTETSLMLALAPHVVRLASARPGVTRPIRELLPELERAGVGAVSTSGVLGDPTGASAEEGAALLDRLVADLAAAVVSRFGSAA